LRADPTSDVAVPFPHAFAPRPIVASSSTATASPASSSFSISYASRFVDDPYQVVHTLKTAQQIAVSDVSIFSFLARLAENRPQVSLTVPSPQVSQEQINALWREIGMLPGGQRITSMRLGPGRTVAPLFPRRAPAEESKGAPLAFATPEEVEAGEAAQPADSAARASVASRRSSRVPKQSAHVSDPDFVV
jgi:hypothetical protein